MKPNMISLVLFGALSVSLSGGGLASAQEQDLLPSVNKATADLAAADKVVVAARNRLQAAKNNLDTTRFSSAAYNARVATQQEAAAKDKYEKVDPIKVEEKKSALESYQLTQELAAARKTALQTAEKTLPTMEAGAKAAEEKYSVALAAAEKLAGQIKSLVRQTESESRTTLLESKLAMERAAFAKATAQQQAATNAQIAKAMAELAAADKALRQTAIGLKKATDSDRTQKRMEAEKATKAYATAVKSAARYLPAFKTEQAKAVGWVVSLSLVDADKAAQKATAAVSRATQDVQNRIKAVKQAETRVKAGQEGVKNRVAKIRAQKDLAREQAAAERAIEAKRKAESALQPLTLEAEKIQQQYAVALGTALETLAQAPEVELVLAEKRAAAAKTVLDQAVADKATTDSLLAAKLANAQQAISALTNADNTLAAAKSAAEKVIAEKAVAEKVVVEKTAAAQVATEAAAAEQDPEKKKAAVDAVAKASAEKAAAEKALADKLVVIPVAGDALVVAQSAQGPIRVNADKANAERSAAEKQGAEKTALVQQATANLASATKAVADSKASVQTAVADRAVIATAMADKGTEMREQHEALNRSAAEAQVAADKSLAAVASVNKVLAARAATREALKRIQRQRFYRAATSAQAELRLNETRMAAARKERNLKISTLAKATASFKQAKVAEAKVRKVALAQAALVANATKAKDVAATAVQKLLAAKVAAEKKVEIAKAVAATGQATLDKATLALKAVEKTSGEAALVAKAAEQKTAALQAAVDKATAAKNTVEQKISQAQLAIDAARTKISIAKSSAYDGLKPIAESEWSYAKARHLLVRAGFGGTPDEVAKLHSMGVHRAVRSLVNYSNQPTADIAFVAEPKERAERYEKSLPPVEQRLLRDQRVAKDRQQIQRMRVWWLRRMIESPRPLEEKLTLFWHGQIPAQYSEVGDSYYMYLQNQLFRVNAAGNFAALLHGIAHDAAMLKYLNNDTNVKGKANENLARELMELFSMGRDQGYSETDIRQGARALTGYTHDPMTGQFRFVSQRHDAEAKTIFGKKGNWNGDDFARMILETPYPAKFIAQKMFVFFVHDEPSADTVEALANVLRLNNYELRPMLENLFLSEEFYSSQAMQTQIKGPIQLVVGLHRDLGLKSADYNYLVSAVRAMGQELFEPPSVFGWQSGRSWVSTSRTFSRYNALAEILERRPRNGKTGVDVVGTLLAGKNFKDHGEVVDYLVKSVCNVPLADRKRQALIDFLKPLPPTAEWAAKPGVVNSRLTRLLVMLICSPESQLS